MSIRNSAKAIIISSNKVLLTKNQDDDGIFYLLPGGGQEHGETIHKALIRECVEEIGEQVEIGELLHIREYIGKIMNVQPSISMSIKLNITLFAIS
jgi:8-oxo-dGTP diphosphatase